jgi:hypothetical protein
MNIQQAMFLKLSVFINPETNLPWVNKWGQQPQALDILQLGDYVEKEGKTPSTDIVFQILENMLMGSLISENISLDQLTEKAYWRVPEPIIKSSVVDYSVIKKWYKVKTRKSIRNFIGFDRRKVPEDHILDEHC